MPASYGRWDDAGKRGQRALALVHTLAARLAFQAQALQARDLPCAFHPRRVPRGQVGDQPGYAFAQLQSEMGGGGAHQLAHVLHAHLVPGLLADGVLGLAHFVVVAVELTLLVVDVEDELLGAISSIPSSSAWVAAPIALSSPISQP
jgi:hypothetical protein